jgi:hypothetical protein
VDGQVIPTRERAAPNANFPNRLCAAALPAGARHASIEGQTLPVPHGPARRLVIFGDTGCRVLGHTVQNCNDPNGWPFARVAALAAARKPDLVVHVGDYYYREAACPAGDVRCAGSPFGDRWATWKAELFDPAKPLLAAAPWVFTRGNHEDCKRGGAGWFRLLDAARAPKTCPARSDTFAVDVAGARLLIADSADTNDVLALDGLVSNFVAELKPELDTAGSRPVWIVTHRPIWHALRFGETLSDGIVNQTERAAARRLDLTDVQLVLAGHVHNFTALDFGTARPAQLIVGAGGDLMDRNDTPPPAIGPVQVDGLKARAFSMGRFGYFLFDREGSDWVGAFRDLTDQVVVACRLHGRDLACHKP